MRTMKRLNVYGKTLGLATAVVFFFFANLLPAQDQATVKVDFVKDIKPIFEQHCLECHGPDKEENFRIDQRDSTMDFIIPGEAKNSEVYTALVSEDPEEKMPPPEEAEGFTDSHVQLIKDWIDQGADWPDNVIFEKPLGDSAVQDPPAKEAPTVGATSEEKKVDPPLKNEPPVENATEVPATEQKKPNDQPAKPAAPKPDYSIWNAIGSLHPAILHLPIGLLIAAGLFSLVGFRGNFVMSDCAYYCLWLGTFGSILACATGWWFSPLENKGTVSEVKDLWDQTHPVFWHRSGALIATLFAFLLCLFAKSARSRDPDDGFLWKLGAVVLACGIGFVGHTGGKMTHGKNLYRDLFGLIEQQTGWDLDGVDNAPAKVRPKDLKSDGDSKSDEKKPPVEAGLVE